MVISSNDEKTNLIDDSNEAQIPSLVYIGIAETDYMTLNECPRNTRYATGKSYLKLDPCYLDAMLDIEQASHILVLYWLDKASRDTLRSTSPFDGVLRGVFASRSPNRPNPIGFAVLELLSIDGATITTSPLDCLNGTPIIDIKPYVKVNDSRPDAQLTWLDQTKTSV